MGKGKSSKRKVLCFIPFVIQLIIHVVASGGFMPSNSGNPIWRLFGAALITAMAMVFGEGYGSIAFIVAGFYDRVWSYILVIVLSVVSAGASFVGYMFSGIEGLDSLWMTLIFCCIDVFLFIYSIIRLVQLGAKHGRS